MNLQIRGITKITNAFTCRFGTRSSSLRCVLIIDITGFVFTLIGANAGDFFDRGEAPDLTVFWSFEFLGPLICLIILVAFPMFLRVARYNHD